MIGLFQIDHLTGMKEPQLVVGQLMEFMITKIKSFAHDEYNKDEYLDINKLDRKIKNKQDIYYLDAPYNIIRISFNSV